MEVVGYERELNRPLSFYIHISKFEDHLNEKTSQNCSENVVAGNLPCLVLVIPSAASNH